jgi:hypothetical protein
MLGSAQQVIDKILAQHEIFRHQRFMAQFSVGTMPHKKIMRAIELLGTEVAPVIRREMSHSTEEAAEDLEGAVDSGLDN